MFQIGFDTFFNMDIVVVTDGTLAPGGFTASLVPAAQFVRIDLTNPRFRWFDELQNVWLSVKLAAAIETYRISMQMP